jgi:N-ethylmaleimide reductase
MASLQLYSPVSMGALESQNRIVMAPLTRARATEAHVPTAMMATYYAQRASCGLIVSEATAVHPLGMGWYRAPGIWTEEMVDGWRAVTGAVHEAGGLIVCQLWHMGRLVLPDYLDGALPIGPSPIAGEGETFAPRQPGDAGMFLPMKPYVVPREMNRADIDEVVRAYGEGARNAAKAGFDGVEIHGANGYIIDQFLQSNTNRRSDAYGGSAQNRLRLLREVIEAVVPAIGADRTGLRISPTSLRKGMGDEDPALLAQLIGALAQEHGLAYIHLIEPIAPGFMEPPEKPVLDDLRQHYTGSVILNGSFTPDAAEASIAAGKADAVSFGRPYIANPDLVMRFRQGLPLAEPNFDYAYVGDETGYIDYPVQASGG